MALSSDPTYLALTVTIKVTPEQRAAYADSYDLTEAQAVEQIRNDLPEVVKDALHTVRNSSELLRGYCTHGMSSASFPLLGATPAS